jgi:glycerol-3-phosphate acyltransferase PlsY
VSDLFNSYLFYTCIGFLSGSVMYAYSLPKLLKGVDVRDAAPDRNPGGANAILAAGKPIGLLCIFLDILKAFLPVYAAVAYARISGAQLIPVVVAPVLGHAFSPLLRFRGGKAVAAFYGVLLGLWPVSRIVLLPALFMAIFKFIVVVTPDSLCVFISLFFTLCAMFFVEPNFFLRAALFLIGAIVAYKVARNPNQGKITIKFGGHILLTADFLPKLPRP